MKILSGVQVFRRSGVQEQHKPTFSYEEQLKGESSVLGPEYLNTRRPEYRSLIIFLFLFLLLCPLRAVHAQQEVDDITLTTEGMAALNGDVAGAEEEAIWDAKRNAVEQAAGVFLRARTVGRDFTLERDEIQGSTQGFIRHWEVVPGSRHIENLDAAGKSRILHIQVRATVALLPVIHRLADIADAYNDLERPRLRVRIDGDSHSASAADSVRTALIEMLHQQGFEMADSGPAEVELAGRIKLVPTVQIGAHDTPYDVGSSLAACRAELTLQVVSTAAEEVLFSLHATGDGQSFQSDDQAAEDAAHAAANALLDTSRQQFIEPLLVRWAREREEGHTVVIKATGLNFQERDHLRQAVRMMRGFCRFSGEQEQGGQWSLHFVTRLATRDVRRRLAALPAQQSGPLNLLNARGPIILCSTHSRKKQG